MAKTGDVLLKDQERAKLEADVEEFLRRGGVIEQVNIIQRTASALSKPSKEVEPSDNTGLDSP